ncbi:MAG: hypothetical protein ACLP02_02395 [Rhodomicrobium sp.]
MHHSIEIRDPLAELCGGFGPGFLRSFCGGLLSHSSLARKHIRANLANGVFGDRAGIFLGRVIILRPARIAHAIAKRSRFGSTSRRNRICRLLLANELLDTAFALSFAGARGGWNGCVAFGLSGGCQAGIVHGRHVVVFGHVLILDEFR